MVTFLERLGAYIIDILIVSLLLGLIGYGLPNNTDDINDSLVLLEEQYMNDEITMDVYLEESYELIYELQDESKLSSFIGVALTVAYFVVFQALYNGQTLGKKLLKLRVVDCDSKQNIGIVRMLIRSLFTLSIFSSVLNLILLLFMSKETYIATYMIIFLIEYVFIIIAVILILYRKDKRGLHDLMAKTCVVKEV